MISSSSRQVSSTSSPARSRCSVSRRHCATIAPQLETLTLTLRRSPEARHGFTWVTAREKRKRRGIAPLPKHWPRAVHLVLLCRESLLGQDGQCVCSRASAVIVPVRVFPGWRDAMRVWACERAGGGWALRIQVHGGVGSSVQ